MAQDSTALRVAGNVRAEMGRRKYSQSALARELNTTQQSLSLRLNGKVTFRVDELARIADILDIPLTELVNDDAQAAS